MKSNEEHRPPSAKQLATRWRLLGKGLQVRLRFAFAIAVLGVLMALWPWLRGAWESTLAKWSSSLTDSSVSADKEFFCPMDPGVVSVWPAICPICNMDLIVRKKADAEILPDGVLLRMQLSPYRVQLAGVRTTPVGQIDSETEPSESSALRIPITALIHRGNEQFVYVETMPGMFDGVRVSLGQREGDFYQVNSGLKLGQKVVTTAAFLVDAESRLNPAISTQYLGGNREVAPKAKRTSQSLSRDDQKLVELQRFCPVTKLRLGSMGTPTFVMIKNRRVALCCDGCREDLLADPEPLLNWLDAHLTTDAP